MKRRDFLTAAAVAGVAATTAGAVDAQTRGPRRGPLGAGKREGRKAGESRDVKIRSYIELRTYQCKNAEKTARLVECIDNALIPALGRLSIKPVGAFTAHADYKENPKYYENTVFVLLQHANARSFTGLSDRLLADKVFVKDAAAVLGVPLAEEAYETYESDLLYGFPTCPAIEVPVKSPERVMQLRYYKSYNIDRNAAKMHMFDKGGELKLFRELGMNPVFFGEMLFGRFLPNMTYMLGFENDEVRKTAWANFVKHPEWEKIKSDPMYKETATKIVNIFLKPTPGSQI